MGGMDKLNGKGRVSPVVVDSRSDDLPQPDRRSILVVDDEDNFLTLFRWFFAGRGYDVATASSPDEALRLLAVRSFNVALVDVKLGPGDGITLLEQLTQGLPELKVIMMTAYPTVGSIKQAFDKGAIRYLTKPLNLPELADTINQLF
jgi:DNA-binding NtrC family response regulator